MRPSILVRDATEADVQAIAAVQRRSRERGYRGLLSDVYITPATDAVSQAHWRDALRSRTTPGNDVLVAELDDIVVGVAATHMPASGPIELWALYIDPSHWRRGIARALTAAAMHRAAAIGQTEMIAWVLSTNDPAKQFYLANGWWLDGGEEVRGSRERPYTVHRLRHTLGRP
jgi:ribosomal protein S18 acetylase RimI-like enzyme